MQNPRLNSVARRQRAVRFNTLMHAFCHSEWKVKENPYRGRVTLPNEPRPLNYAVYKVESPRKLEYFSLMLILDTQDFHIVFVDPVVDAEVIVSLEDALIMLES